MLMNKNKDICTRIFHGKHSFLNNSVLQLKADSLKEELEPHYFSSVYTLLCFLGREWNHRK